MFEHPNHHPNELGLELGLGLGLGLGLEGVSGDGEWFLELSDGLTDGFCAANNSSVQPIIQPIIEVVQVTDPIIQVVQVTDPIEHR